VEKTESTLSHIAIVGSISSAGLNASSFFLRSILPSLAEYYRIDIFTNERNPSPRDQSINGAEEIFHIHQLPEFCSKKKYKVILYSIENSKESFLYRWYAVLYPGIILLQDKNLFRLESGSLRYGTDGRDLNALIQSHHGSDVIPVGDQHVRGRSLEIYAELYHCLESLLLHAVGIGVFLPIEILPISCVSSKPVFYLRRPIELTNNSICKRNIPDRREYTVLVIVDSPFSRSAQDILINISNDFSSLHFPLACTIKVGASNYEIIDYELLPSDFLLEYGANSKANFDKVLILGHRPHSSIKSQCFLEFIKGVSISSEYLGEFTELPSSFSIPHSREDSLEDILQGVSSQGTWRNSTSIAPDEYRLHNPFEVARTLYENIESICQVEPSLLLRTFENRNIYLINMYKKINNNYDSFSDNFTLASEFVEKEKSKISSLHNDLFGVS
jgi:hypothetical protein